MPEEATASSLPEARAASATPTTQPVNALASIVPSMPMLTTPDRSHMTPHMAPRASGVAGTHDERRDRRNDLDDVADQLEQEPQDRDPVQPVDRTRSIRPPPGQGPRTSGRPGRQIAVDARRIRKMRRSDRVGDQEEQDHGLEDVDQLDRDAGPDLHQPGAGPHRPEQERREQDAERVGAAEQGDGDRVEADRVVKRRVHLVGDAEDDARAGQPGQQPAIVIVRMISSRGRIPA